MDILSAALDTVAIGRWQFGITTVYHFFLVPLTIGLSLCVAIMQSLWYATGKDAWLHATRFFGKLLLINFALGVATGIVQEFQFGMNWSEYSRYVGDIFGAPLAIEALLAFFLESTFLGLWIFGWGRLSKGVHLLMIWLVTAGVNLSALWILAANSWMQHPVGTIFNPATGRAELDGVGGFFQLLLNPVLWFTFSHVITSAWLLTGTFITGIAVWWMTRAARQGGEAGMAQARNVWRPVTIFGLWVIVIGGLGTAGTGHFQGQELVEIQPAKMAAAEGICVDTEAAAFTVAMFGDCPLDRDGAQPTRVITVPGVASFMATNSFTAPVEGVADVQERMVDLMNSNEVFVEKYGDASQYNFIPPQMPVFWSFRIMIGTAAFSALLALWGLWAIRKDRVPTSVWLGRFGIFSIPMPFIGVATGWIFTEMGRQPWVVVPNLVSMQAGDPLGDVNQLTPMGISTAVSAGQMLTTMILFTVLYLALGVVWVWLMRRYVLEGVSDFSDESKKEVSAQALNFGY